MITKPCQHIPVPPEYPFTGKARDSYTYCVCGEVQPPPPPSPHLHKPHPAPPSPHFPSHGPFRGSAFALTDTMPYLIDTTYTSYGQVLCYSESVHTKITQRKDPSCINLAATFNFTDTTLPNSTRTDFLEKHISRKYSYLMGVLPIIKSSLKFKVYYTITDVDHGVTHQGVAVSTVLDNFFHFTDIPDMYVQSARGVIIETIPAMTYQGLYTLTIDRVELYATVIDTKEHLQDGLNPFYSFTDNNMKIRLNHQTIESLVGDEELLIAQCDVNKSFDYYANITNRLRLTFVGFTSVPIASGDTSRIWEAMNEPTGEIINQLRLELSAVEDEIKILHEIIEQQNILIQNLNGQITLNKNNIASLTTRVANLEANGESYDTRLDDHERRITVLEAIPLATWSYRAGNEFVRAQITWKTYGQLYQVTRNYTASGNFERDIAEGNLVPITTNASDLIAITDRLDAVETTANNANDIATSTQNTVEGFASSITDNTNSISTINSNIAEMNTDIEGLKTTVPTISEKANKNETDITTLTGLVDDMTESIAVMDSDIQTIKDDIEDIKEVLPINPDIDPDNP